MINLSDDSEDEESLETHSAASATPWVPKDSTSRRRAMTLDSVSRVVRVYDCSTVEIFRELALWAMQVESSDSHVGVM